LIHAMCLYPSKVFGEILCVVGRQRRVEVV